MKKKLSKESKIILFPQPHATPQQTQKDDLIWQDRERPTLEEVDEAATKAAKRW